jgi:uncharacterized membrane protein YccF (DUF307 family)
MRVLIKTPLLRIINIFVFEDINSESKIEILMRTVTKVLWHFPLFGSLNAILSFVIAILFYITVLGIPLGEGMMELGKFFLMPYSKAIQKRNEEIQQYKDLWTVFGFFARILYLPFGILLAILVLIQIALLYLSIIGIPLAKALFKVIPDIFNPVNKECKSMNDEI